MGTEMIFRGIFTFDKKKRKNIEKFYKSRLEKLSDKQIHKWILKYNKEKK